MSNDFSLELWFATRSGIGTAITQWWQGAGLLDAEVPGVVDDFGTSLDATGRVWAGTGHGGTQPLTSAPGLRIGVLQSGVNFLAGSIADAAVYATALPATTVTAHFQARH